MTAVAHLAVPVLAGLSAAAGTVAPVRLALAAAAVLMLVRGVRRAGPAVRHAHGASGSGERGARRRPRSRYGDRGASAIELAIIAALLAGAAIAIGVVVTAKVGRNATNLRNTQDAPTTTVGNGSGSTR